MILSAASRRLILLGPPAILLVVELFHATHFSDHVFQGLAPRLNEWLWVHSLQLPLFGLLALGLYTVLRGIHNKAAAVARIALFFFVIYYSAFDAVAGLGTGLLIKHGLALPEPDQKVVADVAQAYFLDPYLGGINSWMSQFASLTWLVSAAATALSLYLVRKPLVAVVLLICAGISLWISHAYPFGPLACAFLLGAYGWLEFKGKEEKAPFNSN